MADDPYKQDRASNPEKVMDLSKVFKGEPSIKNYVKLRRNHPHAEIEIAIAAGLDWLLANESTLEKHGIEPALFAGVLDADPASVSELSLQLLELIVIRENAIADGQTQVVGSGKSISEGLISYLICTMLDAMSWNDELEINRDLIVLIRHQLGGGQNNAISQHQNSHELKSNAAWIGAQLLETTGSLSLRKIATALGVNVTTISRMSPGNSLAEEARINFESMKSMTKSDTPFADIANRNAKKPT